MSSFAEANQAFEADQASKQSADSESAPSTETSEHQGRETATQSNSTVDIDKLEKFMFEGKEWTKDDLRKSVLMHQDYTRKTQEVANERKAIETERKFNENMPYDLEKVARDPNLADQFKRLYPQKYHAVVDKLLTSMGIAPKAQTAQVQDQRASLPQAELERIDRLESMLKTYETEKYETQLNATFDKLKAQYPKASEEMIIARAQAALNSGVELNDSQFAKLFKDDHEKRTKEFDDYYLSKIKDQKSANRKGRDVPPGGAEPSGAAPKKMTMKEATAAAIRDLSTR